jgi:hypothetical protein
MIILLLPSSMQTPFIKFRCPGLVAFGYSDMASKKPATTEDIYRMLLAFPTNIQWRKLIHLLHRFCKKIQDTGLSGTEIVYLSLNTHG